jgi:hypothetical protein
MIGPRCLRPRTFRGRCMMALAKGGQRCRERLRKHSQALDGWFGGWPGSSLMARSDLAGYRGAVIQGDRAITDELAKQPA